MRVNETARRPKGFPSSVVLRGERWRVRYFHRLHSPPGSSVGRKAQKVLGLAFPQRREIHLDVGYPRHEIADTLLHEIQHAYLARHLRPKAIRGNVEEWLCDRFAEWVRDLAENNPETVRALYLSPLPPVRR